MSSPRITAAALSVSVAVVASGAARAEHPQPAGTGADADPQRVVLKEAYHDRAEDGVCRAGTARDIVGLSPAGDERRPVFVYLTGTTMKFDGPEAQKLIAEMARRGFFSVTVEYDNDAYPYCREMLDKAECLWGQEGSESALQTVCSHRRADCDAGIVVAGFSQGANLASLSKNHDGRVRGAYLLGHGHKATTIRVTPCMRNAATALGPGEMRSVNGEQDFFFGRSTPQVRRQLEVVVGAECPDAFDCEHDGGGWHIVRATELSDGKADHCYFLNAADFYCADFDGFDPGWENGDHRWSLGPSLDWLASRVDDPPESRAASPAGASRHSGLP